VHCARDRKLRLHLWSHSSPYRIYTAGSFPGDKGDRSEATNSLHVRLRLKRVVFWCYAEKSLSGLKFHSVINGTGLDNRGSRVDSRQGMGIFLFPPRPDLLWGPLSLLSNGYRGLSGQGVKLTIRLLLVPRSRMRGSIPSPPIRLHGVVLS
jgi:hypothetical protein